MAVEEIFSGPLTRRYSNQLLACKTGILDTLTYAVCSKMSPTMRAMYCRNENEL